MSTLRRNSTPIRSPSQGPSPSRRGPCRETAKRRRSARRHRRTRSPRQSCHWNRHRHRCGPHRPRRRPGRGHWSSCRSRISWAKTHPRQDRHVCRSRSIPLDRSGHHGRHRDRRPPARRTAEQAPLTLPSVGRGARSAAARVCARLGETRSGRGWPGDALATPRGRAPAGRPRPPQPAEREPPAARGPTSRRGHRRGEPGALRDEPPLR